MPAKVVREKTRGQSHLRLTRALGALLIALGLLGSLAMGPLLAASIVVNSLADSAADDGFCTLREAITAANTDTPSALSLGECPAGSGTDAITFDVAGTITLTSALPAIASDVSISGAGVITVSGTPTGELFVVSIGTVTFAGLTITAGLGGISNLGGTVTVTHSAISGNSRFAGGGILNSGTLTVTNSTISENSAVFGGGIANNGTLSVANSTISGNRASSGTGIHNTGTLNLTNSTISGNATTGPIFSPGGGILASGTETLVNSIVAGNTALGPNPDVNGPAETVTTSVIGVPPGLTLADILDPAGLAHNGGPTQTIALALVAGNPAIDTATSATCAADPVNSVDQRGMPRPAACDIGAYEAQVAVPAPSPSPTASPAPLPNTAASSGTNAPSVLLGTLALLSFFAALAVGCTQRGGSNSRR